MKRYLSILWAHLPWLVFALLCDLFFAIMLWITDARAFAMLTLSIVLFSILGFLLICALILVSERRMTRVLSEYLQNPDEAHKEILLSNLKGEEKARAAELCELLSKKDAQLNHEITRSGDYEEYVEAWAHEAKTPLALLTMILDNNRENMGPEMIYKIEYVRARLSESVEQMLQYSRIKGERKDYLFEALSIREILDEVIEDYRPLLVEKSFTVINDVKEEKIYADHRALRYMLGQFVSNSIKYSSIDPRIVFRIEDENRLVIEDNGIGVKKSDLPFLFERGFTGNTGQARKKATGMGLYLAAKLAEDMNMELKVRSEAGKGFEIVVQYPKVEF